MSVDTLTVRGDMWYVIGISLVAALGGFLFGFDMIVVSGAIKSITALFDLEGFRLGWATSCCVFVCIPRAAFAGKLALTQEPSHWRGEPSQRRCRGQDRTDHREAGQLSVIALRGEIMNTRRKSPRRET
jgi:hypothetical protein